MKILHVHKFFGWERGAEVYVHRLMAHQKAAGHEVHVFSTRSTKNVPSDDGRFFVERLSLSERQGFVQDIRTAMKFLWNSEAKRSLARMLDEIKPDVVHLHNIYHHLSSSILVPIRERGIPCVMTLHDYKLASPNYALFCHGAMCEHAKGGHYFSCVWHGCLPGGFFVNALAAFEMSMTKWRRSYERTVRFFLCPSRFMKKTMEEWGEPAEQLRYLPNPVDASDEPAMLGGGYLLYVGSLSSEKGLSSFLEAAARVPEVTIKIAGHGPEEGPLKILVRDLKAQHIEFLGFIEPGELIPLRDRAEGFVLPSLSPENASLALLEAMAQGLPCLTTRVGGNPELVEDGVNGFLVAPGNVDEWERVLKRFAVMPKEARQEMGAKGRERAKRLYNWPDHLKGLEQAYRDATMKT